VRLRRFGRERGGGQSLFARVRGVGHVQQSDGEIDAGECEPGVELQGAAEGFGPFGVLELFEQRDAQIVRAVRLLARLGGGVRLRGRAAAPPRGDDGEGEGETKNDEGDPAGTIAHRTD
jgi:hypothetical protein